MLAASVAAALFASAPALADDEMEEPTCQDICIEAEDACFESCADADDVDACDDKCRAASDACLEKCE